MLKVTLEGPPASGKSRIASLIANSGIGKLVVILEEGIEQPIVHGSTDALDHETIEITCRTPRQ